MKKKINSIIINNLRNGKTIKEILINELKLSERIIKNIKNINGIIVNGKNENVNYILKENDMLELYLDDDLSENIVPQEMKLDILYEDDNILAINKSPGIVVHPTSFHPKDTLANGVMLYFSQKGIFTKFRPVNRLDRDTSGVIIIAKNQIVHSKLSNQMSKNEFKKEYIAVVHNSFTEKDGIINLPISRKRESLIERTVDENGQSALTEYNVISQNNHASLIEIRLLTGRTHQIRVHFSHIGHPLFGDTLYGHSDFEVNRQALHCQKVSFIHPLTNRLTIIEADIPEDITGLIRKLNLDILL